MGTDVESDGKIVCGSGMVLRSIGAVLAFLHPQTSDNHALWTTHVLYTA
jgi:hypothetical protein